MSMSRLLAFDKLHNIRDVGFLETKDGKKLVTGKLFRCGHLAELSDEDYEKLACLVNIVVDFRTDGEREEKPDIEIPGIRYYHIPIMDSLTAGITREEEADQNVFSRLLLKPAEAKQYMCDMYRTFATSEFAVSQYAVFLRLLLQEEDVLTGEEQAERLNPETSELRSELRKQNSREWQSPGTSELPAEMSEQGIVEKDIPAEGSEAAMRTSLQNERKAVLWHCTAGKDRAGVAAAILEELLGVSRENIIEDYLTTNKYLAADIQFLTDFVKKQAGTESEWADESLRYLFGAEREYIEAFYTAVREKYGDFNGFVKKGLQVSEEEVSELKRRYLA